MSMYNLIEYNDAYLKTPRSLWQYYRDEPARNITDFFDSNNNGILFKFKQQIIKKKKKQTENGGTKEVEIILK